MTAPDLSCSVYVDGTRLADTAESYLASVPTVLTGLTTAWGRGTIVDQPDTSTCSFTVRDKDGDADFLGLLYVGRPVDVYSSGPVIGSAAVDVAQDGDFEVTPPAQRVLADKATVTAAYDAAADNNYYRARNPSRTTGTVYIPPAPWGTSAEAWDGIPAVSAGETWTVRLKTVRAAAVGTATVSLALFTTTLKGPPAVQLTTVAAAVNGVTEVSALIYPAHPVAWVGAVLTVNPAPRWLDLPGTWTATVGTWLDQGTWSIDELQVIAPPQARHRVSVFSGRITDLEASAAGDGVAVAVTAVDPTADLANDAVGDTPWPAQTIAQRVTRIRQLATVKFTADIDAGIAPLRVSYRDVDSQPVATLLGELAVSGDAVLWSAVQAARGFYMWFEDPTNRASLAILAWNTGTGQVEIVNDYRPAAGVVISACGITRDAVYRSDVADVITRVDLTWQEQTLDGQGAPAPTDRTVTVSDDAASSVYGVRRASVSTQLIAQADAVNVGNRVLARSRSLGWHASVLGVDFGILEPSVNTALTLLDGTKRIGLPLTVTDLPGWAPNAPNANMYVEGGEYTFASGSWTLGLNVSPAGTTGYSALWADLDPAWDWHEFADYIRWVDVWGAAAEDVSPRWAQMHGLWNTQTDKWQDLWGPQTTGKAA